ncbi:MAG: hypothetical protein ABFC95_08330 [Smithella sp.]
MRRLFIIMFLLILTVPSYSAELKSSLQAASENAVNAADTETQKEQALLMVEIIKQVNKVEEMAADGKGIVKQEKIVEKARTSKLIPGKRHNEEKEVTVDDRRQRNLK